MQQFIQSTCKPLEVSFILLFVIKNHFKFVLEETKLLAGFPVLGRLFESRRCYVLTAHKLDVGGRGGCLTN